MKPSTFLNIGRREHLLSLSAGLGFFWKGFHRRRSLPGILLLLVGGLLVRRGWRGHCEAYDVLRINKRHPARRVIRRTIRIARPAAELYAFWRNPVHLASLSPVVLEVLALDDLRSHWKVVGLPDTGWIAQILEDRPNEIIAWETVESSVIEHAGTVRFEALPAGAGTAVHIQLAFRFLDRSSQSLTAAVSEKLLADRIDHALARLRARFEDADNLPLP